MDEANIIDLLFRGNIIEPPEGSLKVHVINKNDISSVPDCCGFRIIVHGQEESDRGDTNVSYATNKENIKQLEAIKCLTSWSVHRKVGFSNELVIKGKLIDQKSTTWTILETKHNAGIVRERVKKDEIVTSKGTYHLMGPPHGPRNKINDAFYDFWTVSGGGFLIRFNEFNCSRKIKKIVYF